MAHDANYILPLLGLNASVLDSATSNVEQKRPTEQTTRNNMGVKNIDILGELSLAERKRLKGYYRNELDLFGYGFEPESNTVTCGSKELPVCC